MTRGLAARCAPLWSLLGAWLLAGCPVEPGSGPSADTSGEAPRGGADTDSGGAACEPTVETCDGVDNDCDGLIDEEDAVDAGTWYVDADGDGWGDPTRSITACSGAAGVVSTDEDCDDDDPTVYPGAEELCGDGVINACDGDVATAMSACGLEGGSLPAVADRVFVGATLYDHAGNEGACAGDVDGDGRLDLLIGAWLYGTEDDPDAWYTVGAAHLLLGSGLLSAEAGTLSLAEADVSIVGHAYSGYAGMSLDGAGDVDGDGLDDLLVGAVQADGGDRDNGEAYLMLGGGALAAGAAEVSVLEADLVLYGERAYDYASRQVARAGDMDGDGLGDVLISAYGADSAGADSGTVYLLLGGGALAAGGSPMSLSGADLKITGEAAGDNAGVSVVAGDLDGDGVVDLVVGAWLEDTAGDKAGAAYLLLGGGALSLAGPDLSLASADLKLLGESAAADAGSALSVVQDVDGDGLDELLIAAFRDDSVGEDAGAAYLLRGGGALSADRSALSLGEADLKIVGRGARDRLGDDLSTAGDFNGDGLGDLLIGLPNEESSGHDSGAATLFLSDGSLGAGATLIDAGDAEVELLGDAEGDDAGYFVSGPGDVNGDGFDDLLIGAPKVGTGEGYWSGAAYLIYGGGY